MPHHSSLPGSASVTETLMSSPQLGDEWQWPAVKQAADAWAATPGASTTKMLAAVDSPDSDFPAQVAPLVAEASTKSTATTAAATNADEQRRQRHNANERRRTNALKTRILQMREELHALELQRDRLQQAANASNAANAAAPKAQEAQEDDRAQQYLGTVRAIDQLRNEQQLLRQQLRAFDMRNSTLQTVLTEFRATPESRAAVASSAIGGGGGGATAIGAISSLSNGQQLHRRSVDNTNDDSEGASDDGSREIFSEDAPIFQRVLLPRPLPLADVMAVVKQFYDEIMRFRGEREFESLDSEIFGWRDRRVLNAHSLRFMLSQQFECVPAEELVYKTWNLLTTLGLYRRIQPRTEELRLLQRVTDDCVIVRLSVSSNSGKVHQSILLIARGRIDGGFLITYRSIPLTAAQAQFAASEVNYVHLNNWYMFLDSASPRGSPACEVTLGGTVTNQPVEYLRYLMMEVVAGVVRWQTAVGHSRFRLAG